MVDGSWLMAQGSWLMHQGSWLNAHGQENLSLGPGPGGAQRQIFLGLEQRALRHEP